MKTIKFIQAILVILTLGMLVQCKPQSQLKSGYWQGELQVSSTKAIPFVFKVDGNFAVSLVNASEELSEIETLIIQDSVFIYFPIFDKTLKAKKIDQEHLTGYFYSHGQNKTICDWQASYKGERPTYSVNSFFSDVWHINFQNQKTGIAIVNTADTQMEGSVLRTGGDYRYLQGYSHADSAQLSGFNGGTAYLVNFEKVDSNNIKGNITYLSGSQESFTAYRKPNAELDNAKAISAVKQAGAGFPFQAQNLDGELVNQNNSLFAGKTLLIQISGSWCPNCMDETRYFTELYNKYQPKGLEIVSVYFEYSDDFAKSVAAIRRTQKNLNVPYTMLFGGKVSAENVQKVFTNLQNFYAYPTSVLVNKDGQVVHIYTGFSGPGTGKYFQAYKEEFENSLIEIL